MTTAFTAIPMKITTSAMRFLGCDIMAIYSIRDVAIIDQDQEHQIAGGVLYV